MRRELCLNFIVKDGNVFQLAIHLESRKYKVTKTI